MFGDTQASIRGGLILLRPSESDAAANVASHFGDLLTIHVEQFGRMVVAGRGEAFNIRRNSDGMHCSAVVELCHRLTVVKIPAANRVVETTGENLSRILRNAGEGCNDPGVSGDLLQRGNIPLKHTPWRSRQRNRLSAIGVRIGSDRQQHTACGNAGMSRESLQENARLKVV